MHDILTIITVFVAVIALIVPLGEYLARVYADDKAPARMTWLMPVEHAIYRLCGIQPQQEMNWRSYTASILLFAILGILLLLVIFLAQAHLPLNPQGFSGLSFDLALNAAISFVTNTNWQSYAGETTLSYGSQMWGITVQNFISAAAGMAVAAAMCRGIARKNTKLIGNAWVDMVRSILYVLLPIALVVALFFVSQGVIQNFKAYTPTTALENKAEQLIPQGPAASQAAIKIVGGNGGGFFNANAAHPFENPTAFTNLLQTILILLLPAACVYMFGAMVRDRRQGWMMLAAMTAIFLPLFALMMNYEVHNNPAFSTLPIAQETGNLEGKELRFGVDGSAIWAAATSAAANGSTNSAHSSYAPLGGFVTILFIQFGEIIYGGVGGGLYLMLMYVIQTVFIAGLMVGRTPEFMGKKLGATEIKWASMTLIIPTTLSLIGAAIAVATEAGRAGALNTGAHGFSEILYAYTSASNNNGAGFSGISANTPFYNYSLAFCMWFGWAGMIVAALAIAGSLANKNTVPVSAGTLLTHSPVFGILLCLVCFFGVLTYIPALVLGPIAEHLHMVQGIAP